MILRLSHFYLAGLDPATWFEYPLLKLGKSTITMLGICEIALWVTALIVLNSLIRKFVIQRILARTHLELGLQFAIQRIFGYTFILLGIYVALQVNGFDLSSLAVLAGALGVGLGFGLQNIVANFVSGLILLAERPLAIGDRIEINGVAGQVRQIRLRSTMVITNDNITIIVPNSDLVTGTLTNWSHGDPTVRIRIPIGVAYGTEPEKVKQVLLAVAAANENVLKTPIPSVYFESFGDSSLNFELGVWTREMIHSPRRFRSEINFAIEKAFRENDIEIPFPQRVVHLRTGET
jgi:small-conductance mechanosensitive channel